MRTSFWSNAMSSDLVRITSASVCHECLLNRRNQHSRLVALRITRDSDFVLRKPEQLPADRYRPDSFDGTIRTVYNAPPRVQSIVFQHCLQQRVSRPKRQSNVVSPLREHTPREPTPAHPCVERHSDEHIDSSGQHSGLSQPELVLSTVE